MIKGDDPRRAVLYMIYTAALMPMLNASAKYLTADYPVLEVVWARYAGHLFYMIVAFAPRLGSRLFTAAHPKLQFLRSTIQCVSTLIYIGALAFVPLTTAAAISFTAPFIVTALAPFMLGERVDRMRWLLVIRGFLGALVVLRPGVADVDPAALVVLASAFASALYQIMSRKIAAHDRVETSITYIALVGFLVTSIPLPFVWVTPRSPLDLALFVAMGFFGGFGHYFMQRAFELAPAPFVAPFTYLGLIGATILGFLVFGQWPDIWVWAGSLLIVASGLLMLFYETRRRGSR